MPTLVNLEGSVMRKPRGMQSGSIYSVDSLESNSQGTATLALVVILTTLHGEQPKYRDRQHLL